MLAALEGVSIVSDSEVVNQIVMNSMFGASDFSIAHHQAMKSYNLNINSSLLMALPALVLLSRYIYFLNKS